MNTEDIGKLLLRTTLGVLMLLHGIAKLSSGLGGIMGLLASKGLPEFLAYGVIVGEVLAPLAMIVGYYTRPAALTVAFTMVVAILLVHAGEIFVIGDKGGWAIELQGLFLFGSIATALLGAGGYSLSQGKGTWD